jgi:RimJ/RimL family protein N-acetyltransferase
MTETKTYLAPRHVKTERLLLRPFAPTDHERYARITADPEVMRYMGAGAPNTPDMAWRMLASGLGHWEMLGYGLWAVELPGAGIIGHAGFLNPQGWPGFELGYMLGRDYWGRGYAREATTKALEIAWGTLKRERVISLIRPLNAPSIKLVKSLGASYERTTDLMGGPAEVYVHRATPMHEA